MSGDNDNSNDEPKHEESLEKSMVADVSTEDPREGKDGNSKHSAEEENKSSENSTQE